MLLDGDDGNDTITGGTFVETLSGGDGNDTITGVSEAAATDVLYGGEGDDRLRVVGSSYASHHFGGNGTDLLDVSGFVFGGYRIRTEYRRDPGDLGVRPDYDGQGGREMFSARIPAT